MTVYLAVESGCTTVLLPGWTVVTVATILALAGSPRGRRFILKLLRSRSTG